MIRQSTFRSERKLGLLLSEKCPLKPPQGAAELDARQAQCQALFPLNLGSSLPGHQCGVIVAFSSHQCCKNATRRLLCQQNPPRGIRNRAPRPRWQQWTEGEAVRLVKAAWRAGYQGLACLIAVAWDSQFSPVDIRTLCARHRVTVDGRLIFDKQEDGRAKTGRAAIGTLSGRTERLVNTLP